MKNKKSDPDPTGGDTKESKNAFTRLWKRDELMEKAATELDAAREGGKIKGYKFKKK